METHTGPIIHQLHLHLQNGGATAGTDLIQRSTPVLTTCLTHTHDVVEWRVRGIGEAEEVFKARKILELSLVGEEGKSVMD